MSEEANNPLYQAILVDGGAENYDKWAKSYDADLKAMGYSGHKSVNEKWRSYHESLLQTAGEASADRSSLNHRIFDAGCGTGFVGEDMASFLPPNVFEVYGGDLSPESVEIAKSKKVYTDVKVVNLKEKLPYEADYFDSIVCAGTFLQGHCGPECLPNLMRVLKKGCYLIATVRKKFLEETRAEWEKQIINCNCRLIEEEEMPYHSDAKATVLVMCKQ